MRRIAAQSTRVFSHREHVSTIRSTWATIWNKWLPESGHEFVDAPDFERYGVEFDPERDRWPRDLGADQSVNSPRSTVP